jgi:Sigma-70 region 2
MSERRQLINLAYRLLGSLADAEDAVQETYARWYAMTRQQQDAIAFPRRLAEQGRQPHLPQPARLGPGPARDLRGRMDPRTAARMYGPPDLGLGLSSRQASVFSP